MTLEQRLTALAQAIGADIKALQSAGAGAGVVVYVQQADPLATSPYIWFKTDADGTVLDILKG